MLSTIYKCNYHDAMSASTRPRSTPAGEAWTLISELFHASKHRFFAIAAEFELSPPQVMALRALQPGQPMAMSQLADALHCDNSNVTGIIDRLEDRGLVQRRSAEHDRRVKMLAVTPDGAELRARLLERLDEAPEILTALSVDDQHALRDIMRRALRRD